MPSFSRKSREKLATLDDRLRLILCQAIRQVDFTVIHGHRSHEEQQMLFDMGLSKCRPGSSKHNYRPALAFDFAPYPIDWNDLPRFAYFAGIFKGIAMEHGIELRWGGDWDNDGELKDQTFMDLGHMEIAEGK